MLTLAAHGLFVALLLSDPRMASRPVVSPRELVSIPITLPPLPDVVEPEPEQPLPGSPRGGGTPRRETETPTARVEVQRPAAAITLPSPEVAPRPLEPAPRDVDWYAKAAERAQRYVDGLPESRQDNQPPQAKVRESCKPRESSFAWKKDAKPTGGSGGLTLGWEPPPANAHLFDDMKEGKTPRSSVPDPNKCD